MKVCLLLALRVCRVKSAAGGLPVPGLRPHLSLVGDPSGQSLWVVDVDEVVTSDGVNQAVTELAPPVALPVYDGEASPTSSDFLVALRVPGHRVKLRSGR